MTNVPLNDLHDWQVHRIDQRCDAFEAACKLGSRPRPEDWVGGAVDSERTTLLRELLALEIAYRRQAGQTPTVDEYRNRFPEFDLEWLGGLIGAAEAANEQFAVNLHCPQCHQSIHQVRTEQDAVHCPSCGGSIHVCDPGHASTEPLRSFGKFDLLERVGIGAFGTVWRSHDKQLNRIVAVKVLHAGLLSTPGALERFYREARAAAQLRHPGIVAVHEVTSFEGIPALVSDFVEGMTLRDRLVQRRPKFRDAARLVAETADALEYAHKLGAIHRDVKPANIMVAPGEPNTLGRPLLVDFGLALRPEAEVTMTLDGQIVGTPAYMSPEQAVGKGSLIDHRTDIYSLGVVLYEMLCGEQPFRGSKPMLLQQLLHEEPRRPRRFNDKVPRDLETICLKCLHKEPNKRYSTAGTLADDLCRFLAGAPVQARTAGSVERFFRWVRRRPQTAALVLVSGLAALAVVVSTVALVYNVRLSTAYEETNRARHAEAAERQRADDALYSHRVVLASRELLDNNVGRVEQLLDECPHELRGWEWGYLKRQCHGELRTLSYGTLGAQSYSATSVACRPDGKQLASTSSDGSVRLWDPNTGLAVLLGNHAGGAYVMAYRPDGSLLASAGFEAIQLWDPATGKLVRTLEGQLGVVYSLAFSPDGLLLASGSGHVPFYESNEEDPSKTEIKVWEVATGRIRCTLGNRRAKGKRTRRAKGKHASVGGEA